MNKHTPGPWSFHADTNGWCLVMSGGKDGDIVANVNPESCPNAKSAPAFVVMPAQANARLIAAAPELLAFVEEYIDAFENGMAGESYLHRIAKTAITKATGETV
jgi:hypothetical protein